MFTDFMSTIRKRINHFTENITALIRKCASVLYCVAKKCQSVALSRKQHNLCDGISSICPLLNSVVSAGRIYDTATAVRLFLFHYDSDSNM